MIFRETTLNDIIILDICRHTFVQAHRLYNTESELQDKLRSLEDCDVTMYVHQLQPMCHSRQGLLVMGEAVPV